MTKLLKRPETLILVFLFLGAFAIRSIGIDWGLPSQQFPHSQFNQDETAELFATLQLSEGIYQLGLLRYQPFFYYFSSIFFAVYFLSGLLIGSFSGLADFQAQYGSDLSQFFVAGRYFMVAVGSCTVVLTYIAGKYMFGKRAGFFAALFLALSFGHIVYSKIFRLDSLLPLVFLLAFYMIVRLKEAEPERLRPFVLCGLAVAFAATTKTTGFALVIVFLSVPLVEGWIPKKWPPKFSEIDRRYPFSFTVLIAALVALAGPYFVFQSVYKESSQRAATGIIRSAARRFSASSAYGNSYALSPYRWSLPWHLTSTLPEMMGLTIFVVAIIGLFLMVFDKRHRRVVVYLIITLSAFLIPIGLMRRAPWRDMLPVLPLLAIAAGYGLTRLIERLRGLLANHKYRNLTNVVVGGLILLVILPPLARVINQKILILGKDTRDVAKEWIEDNLPQGSKLALEPFSPGLIDDTYLDEIKLRNRSDTPISVPVPTYNLSMIVEEVGDAREPSDLISFLIDDSIEYVVLSSAYYGRFYNGAIDRHAPELSQEGRSMHDAIENNLEFLAQFIPNPSDTPGPVIKVYRVPADLDSTIIPGESTFDPYPEMEQPASALGYYQFAPR
jgi:hypothetical protein